MNALDVLRVLKRHPIILLIFMVATVAGSVGVYSTLPVSYQDTASVVLLGPNTQLDEKGRAQRINPLQVAGDGSAQITASALVLVANSQSFQRGLVRSGVTSAVTVEGSPNGGGIVIDITTTSRSSRAVVADLPKISSALTTQLREQQQALGAPAQSLYVLRDLTGAGPATAVSGGRLKTSAVAGALGVLITVALVLLYDARLRRRGRAPELAAAADGTSWASPSGAAGARGKASERAVASAPVAVGPAGAKGRSRAGGRSGAARGTPQNPSRTTAPIKAAAPMKEPARKSGARKNASAKTAARGAAGRPDAADQLIG